MSDRILATAGDWALATDGVQWLLMKRVPNSFTGWKPVSFVRSTKDILARCCREKGVDDAISRQLLAGLPDTFDQWRTNVGAPKTPSAVLAKQEDPPHG